MEIASQLVSRFRIRGGRSRELYKLFSSISDVNTVALCGIQQVVIESS